MTSVRTRRFDFEGGGARTLNSMGSAISSGAGKIIGGLAAGRRGGLAGMAGLGRTDETALLREGFDERP